MDAATITAISGALVAIIVAVTGLIAAVQKLGAILIELKKGRAELVKNTALTRENTQLTQETHVMVNSQREAMMAQQTRTDNALRSAGIPIPADPAAHVQVTGSAPLEEGPPEWPLHN
jgi:hypothetical protein